MATAAAQVILVEERQNPTSAYYLDPVLSAADAEVRRFGFDDVPGEACSVGSIVIFVRYVPSLWKDWVQRNNHRLGGIILFVDDDVLDWQAAKGTPWRYRLKLWRLAARHYRWLHHQGVRLWVSTPYLQERYREWSPKLILPVDLVAPKVPPIRVFYHGSASHHAEICWLERVLPAVLEAHPGICFELIADRGTAKAWKGLPRVTLVHPMGWPAYQSFSALSGRDIGLAPLLDNRFNQARSYTKFFDITRSGAVGIYSDHPVFRTAVRDGVDGCLVPNDESQWIEAIVSLADDPALREKLLLGARQRVSELGLQARQVDEGFGLGG